MNTTRTALATAILATLAFLPTAHAATASASASVTDLSFTLIDLNPMDGIAPTLTFNNPYGYNMGSYGYANAYVYDSNFNYQSANNYYLNDFSTSQFVTPGSASAAVGGTTATTASTNSGYSASATAQLHGDPSSEYDYASANASTYPNNNGYYWGSQGFTLSANTAVVVKGKYQVSASVDATGNPYDNAQASVYFGGQMNADDGSSYQSASFNKSVYVAGGNYNYWWGYSTNYLQQDSKSGGFGFALVNASDADASGNFYNAYANASANVYTASAVPEADTLTLALAGLGVASLVASRRRKQG